MELLEVAKGFTRRTVTNLLASFMPETLNYLDDVAAVEEVRERNLSGEGATQDGDAPSPVPPASSDAVPSSEPLPAPSSPPSDTASTGPSTGTAEAKATTAGKGKGGEEEEDYEAFMNSIDAKVSAIEGSRAVAISNSSDAEINKEIEAALKDS